MHLVRLSRSLVLALVLSAGASDPAGAAASGPIVLQRDSGSVNYLAPRELHPLPVIGHLVIQPEDYALTELRSMASLIMPDSSVVSIGSSTKVRVGAFSVALQVSSMSISIMGGALHFSIRHPQGGRSNYLFITPTSQIAIRGTEGMIVVRPGETIVACVHGAAKDMLVTMRDGRRMHVPAGMTLMMRATGGHRLEMSMQRGVSAAEFAQFAPLVAHNHAMRAKETSR